MVALLWLQLALGQTIEPFELTTLDDSSIAIPDDVGKPASYLVFVFAEDQEADAETWNPMLEKHASEAKAYIVAALSPALSLTGGLVRGEMRKRTPDEHHSNVGPLFINRESLLESVMLEDMDRPAIVLIDGEGKVLRSFSGTHTRKRERAFRRALRRVGKQMTVSR